MRLPEYLSPTSIKMFYEDREAFYLRYLSDTKMPREPQNAPMAIGSSFDAYCKSYLHQALFGKGADPQYDFETLFEEQVEPQCRDEAKKAGAFVFEAYKQAGCLSNMMIELGHAVGDPRFEFTINNHVSGVPLLGKPDIFFINSQGARVIYDWKVNGYYANRLKSPMKGYIRLMPHNKIHKDCHLVEVNGIMINAAMFLEDGNKDWADQLSIYSWLLGEEVGSDAMIVGIDQVCGPADKLRFATHRLRISPEHQYDLESLVQNAWDLIINEHVFNDMTQAESLARCALLDTVNYDDPDFDECL
jgi:hypothetical protein